MVVKAKLHGLVWHVEINGQTVEVAMKDRADWIPQIKAIEIAQRIVRKGA